MPEEAPQNYEQEWKDSKNGAKTAAEGDTSVSGAGKPASGAVGELSKKFLQRSWLFLLPSFGATILYINLHFIAKYIGGSQNFCKFGEEWGPPGGLASAAGGKGAMAKRLSKLETPEIIGFLCINLIILAIVSFAVMFFLLIGYATIHPIDFTTMVGTELASAIAGLAGIKLK